MFILLKHLLQNQNEFASGGLLLMVIGSIVALLRELPKQIWLYIVRQTTLVITVKDDDTAFQWVKEWFLEQQFLTHIRRVDLDTTLRGAEMALIPAPGVHLFWLHARPFWVLFHRSDETKGRAQRRVESLTFQTIGRDQAFLRRFVAEVTACHHRKAGVLSSLHVYDEYWNAVQAYSPRLLSSIILHPGDKESIHHDLERFRASRQRYRYLGVPYHRGYLLYGPPGTGKTSLVSALAAEFGMSIYVLNLIELNDRALKAAINEVPENSVILFEDIDCMKAGNRRPDRVMIASPVQLIESANSDSGLTGRGVTLSGLLNVLDGFHAPENVIFVMTTNDVDALDPALLRPGRIDYRLYLGIASPSQKSELYRRFFPEASESEAVTFIRNDLPETMAEFQGRLLQMEQKQAPSQSSPTKRGSPLEYTLSR